jgi:PPOX class probable F420-dependent enzyme
MLDLTTEFGRRVDRRLREERTIWLTTVSSNLIPQPRPVWFLWNGETFLIFTQPGAYKLKHIARNPNVSLHFDSDGRGGDIVVFTGEAHVIEGKPDEKEVEAYLEKYAEGMKRIRLSPDGFAKSYRVAIRVKPTGLRGH